ncbi:unnamed protein product [Plutella xylostella]|uniref:(diamondback moth) hypothetical protein n=1 Tax=Plutella xylostella TaxID=51655 RepID=A0A8S4EWU0_PLUXY|nr:unnamed protein product [Plutella xylostella]
MGEMNVRLAFAIIASAGFSAFQHGYNTGVLNAPQGVMTKWLQMDALPNANKTVDPNDEPTVTSIWAVAVSIYCVGGMIGGVITGVLADRFGRKGSLLMNNALVFLGAGLEGGSYYANSSEMLIVGSLLMNNALVFLGAGLEGGSYYANSSEMLIVGRLLIGINSGLNAGLAPMYLSEISPVSLRGSIGTVYQLVITITIVLSQVLGLSSVLGTASRWSLLLALPLLPAVLQCAALPFCPDSPHYLLFNKGNDKGATKALSWLRGGADVNSEMEEMHQEAEKTKIRKKVTVRELFRNRQLRVPLITAAVVMLAQQLSGINAVIFFSTDIFYKAGLSQSTAQYATLAVVMLAQQLSGINAVIFFSTDIFYKAGLSQSTAQYATLVKNLCNRERSSYNITSLRLGKYIKSMMMMIIICQLRVPLITAAVVMLAQQLSGINAVIFFSTDIFYEAGLSQSTAQYATLGMGAMNVLMTVISLVLVEIAGRKTLLLIGFVGMLLCTVALTVASLFTSIVWVSYVSIALVILFVVMFAVGPGSIPWFLVTELFNQSARPAATAVAVTVNWTANFIVGLSFLPLSLLLGSYVFVIFAVLQFLFILFIYYKVPETKNKTIEEITAMFRQHL